MEWRHPRHSSTASWSAFAKEKEAKRPHVALAKQSSLLGLYDLREALERAIGPLPVEFLAALALIGDASCLEAIAIAHGRTTDRWWREHLADAFQAIVRREQLTRRHAVLKKIQKRWPAIVLTA